MRWLYHAFRLAVVFARELAMSNLAVARIVLSPKMVINPGIIAYKTELTSELTITFLANLITLTPGTLTVEISKDHSILYIHTLNIESPEETTESIRGTFEKELLELER